MRSRRSWCSCCSSCLLRLRQCRYTLFLELHPECPYIRLQNGFRLIINSSTRLKILILHSDHHEMITSMKHSHTQTHLCTVTPTDHVTIDLRCAQTQGILGVLVVELLTGVDVWMVSGVPSKQVPQHSSSWSSQSDVVQPGTLSP